MSKIEKILKMYIEELASYRTSDKEEPIIKCKERLQESYNKFSLIKDLFPYIDKEKSPYIPNKRKGEVYFIIVDNIPLDFIITGHFIYPHHAVLKVSDYTELATERHQKAKLEDEEIIIELNNLFFLRDDEIEASAFRGVLDEDLDLRPGKGDIQNLTKEDREFKKQFEDTEFSLTSMLRERMDYDLSGRENIDLNIIPDHFIDNLPMVASESEDVSEEFAENYSLRRDARTQKLIIDIDMKHWGEFGVLIILNSILFSGILPRSFILGIDDSVNLAALRSAIKIIVGDEDECLH